MRTLAIFIEIFYTTRQMLTERPESSYKDSLKKSAKSFAKAPYFALDIKYRIGQNSQLHSFTASQLHSFTASQLHSFTASQLHSFTASQLHSFTASQLHSFTASQLHSLRARHAQINNLTAKRRGIKPSARINFNTDYLNRAQGQKVSQRPIVCSWAFFILHRLIKPQGAQSVELCLTSQRNNRHVLRIGTSQFKTD